MQLALTFAEAQTLSEALSQFIENTPEFRGEFETEADERAVILAEAILDRVNLILVETTGATP